MTESIIIKKDGKYFNTATKKFISETYAKRIKSFMKRNPDKTLYEAGGHGLYNKKKPLLEHGKDIREMAYSGRKQVIRTYTSKGKKVYYVPMQNKRTKKFNEKIFKKLDYKCCGNNTYVNLYKLSRDRESIFHILTWYINKRISSPMYVEFLRAEMKPFYKSIEKEIKKILKKHKISKYTNMFARVTCTFINKGDGWQQGKVFGLVIPNKSGFEIMEKDYNDILDFYKNRLEVDSYHSIHLEKIVFYLKDDFNNASETQKQISEYRLGVHRMI